MLEGGVNGAVGGLERLQKGRAVGGAGRLAKRLARGLAGRLARGLQGGVEGGGYRSGVDYPISLFYR